MKVVCGLCTQVETCTNKIWDEKHNRSSEAVQTNCKNKITQSEKQKIDSQNRKLSYATIQIWFVYIKYILLYLLIKRVAKIFMFNKIALDYYNSSFLWQLCKEVNTISY